MTRLAVVLKAETLVSPFDEPAREAFFADETIAEATARGLRAAGFEVAEASDLAALGALLDARAPREVLILLDRCFITARLVRDFAAAARKRGVALARLEVLRGAAVDYTLPLQSVHGTTPDGVTHDVVWGSGEAVRATLPVTDLGAEAWLRGVSAEPVRAPTRELVVEAPLPTIGEQAARILRYPITSSVVVSVEHWVHVLWLNQIAFGIRWLELIRDRPLWAAWRAASALSLDRERVLMRMVSRGRGARIHPRAQVSGSIIGAGAVIGPHATVRNSIVGPGAVVLDHAVLIGSVVGARTLIAENTVMVSTVVYPEASVGNYKLQVSLIGRGAYVNAWAGFVDAKFVGEIQVAHRGALVSTERSFLGSVVGHRARVAAKVLIMPGREIPNDTLIVMRPDEIVSVVPADLEPGRPVVRDRGTLVPLGQESRTP